MGIGKGQRPHQDLVNVGKYGAVDADPQPYRRDGDYGKARITNQAP